MRKLHGSFSGALVLLAQPIAQDGSLLPSSVLKYDTASNVTAEAHKTRLHGKDWGTAHPMASRGPPQE